MLRSALESNPATPSLKDRIAQLENSLSSNQARLKDALLNALPAAVENARKEEQARAEHKLRAEVKLRDKLQTELDKERVGRRQAMKARAERDASAQLETAFLEA